MGAYLVQLDHLIYARHDGGPFTFRQALEALYGCAGARVLRDDLTTAVRDAGSAGDVVHVDRAGRERVFRSTVAGCRAVGR